MNRRVFAYADTGIPDGIQLDANGNVYSGCGDGVQVMLTLASAWPDTDSLDLGMERGWHTSWKVLFGYYIRQHGLRRQGKIGYTGRDRYLPG